MTQTKTVARAYPSANVALLAIHSQQKLQNLAGWAIKRKDVATGKETWLQSKVPFKGQSNPNWESHDTTEWPIQKPIWKDFEAPKNTKLLYGFAPVYFDKTQAGGVRCDESAIVWTNDVTLTPDLDDEISVAFTNGFLSTQWLARQVPKLPNGDFDYEKLLGWLKEPQNAIRVHQAGDVLPMFMSAIQQARTEGGKVHLILYELGDNELIDLIIANKDVVSLVLGNTGKDDELNHPTRVRMHEAGVDIIDRMVTGYAIAHNKYVVYVDKNGKLCYIVAGSTNWTTTGLTCQTNTAIRINSENLAKLYDKAFHLYAEDSSKTPTQSAWLRARLAKKPPVVVLKSGARVQAFFSPNTRERTKPKGPHPLPLDRAYGSRVFRETEDELTALFFYPGFPSYLDDIRWLSQNKPDMSVLEVAVSSHDAIRRGDVLLQHRPGQPPVAVVASAIEKAFGDRMAEILKLPDAFAIIHTKAAQGDARHKNRWKVWCMIGSHNGGDTASYKNDDNVLFIFGHRGLAIAMMVNHMDVTDHYRFRAMVNSNSNNNALQGFLSQDDTWQDKYFNDGAALKELDYLTRDDEPEEDGELPDFLQEDSDPNAFDTWGNEGVEWENEATAEEKAEVSRAASMEPGASEERRQPAETPRGEGPGETAGTTKKESGTPKTEDCGCPNSQRKQPSRPKPSEPIHRRLCRAVRSIFGW